MSALRQFLVCDPGKCINCGICELVCSSSKERVFNPHLSRIRVVKVGHTKMIAVACRLCEEPRCVNACLRKALTYNKKTGVVSVDADRCDGCCWCIQACTYGAIYYDWRKKTVFTCDLCNQEPKCIEFCPKEALFLGTSNDLQRVLRSSVKRFKKDC